MFSRLEKFHTVLVRVCYFIVKMQWLKSFKIELKRTKWKGQIPFIFFSPNSWFLNNLNEFRPINIENWIWCKICQNFYSVWHHFLIIPFNDMNKRKRENKELISAFIVLRQSFINIGWKKYLNSVFTQQFGNTKIGEI